MERFHQPGQVHPEHDFLGVAIRQLTDDRFHCGFTYQIGGELKVLHLYWHYQLKLEKLDDAVYGVAEFRALSVDRLQAAKSILKRIVSRYSTGGFSFSLKSYFDSSGRFQPGASKVPGFTCATFVLALFKSLGFELLSAEWPIRPDDQKWQKQVLLELADVLDDDAFDTLNSLIGDVPRYRPEEVAAGCLANPQSADFHMIKSAAEEIARIMSE